MTRRFRVGLIHYAAPPVVGGVEAVLRRHADLLAAHAFEVVVVAGRGEAWNPRVDLKLSPLVDSSHPEILAAKAWLDGGTVPEGFDDLVARVSRQLEADLAGVDLVIAHNVGSLHKNLALTAALQQQLEARRLERLILWHHDLAWLSPRYQGELHRGWPWDLLRQPWGATHVVVSRFRQRQLADLMGLEPSAIHVVPNGISPAESLHLQARTQDLVSGLGLESAHPRLLLPARVTRRKNLELAIRVMDHVRQGMPEAVLVITGPAGPHNPANQAYWTELHDLRQALGLSKQVHFLAEAQAGTLPDSVVLDLYRWADALLLPSWEEGFGIPVLEASLVRMPIFCSAIDPLLELGGVEVVSFPPDASPQTVGRLIVDRLRSDPAYRIAVRARAEYAWERIFESAIRPLVEA